MHAICFVLYNNYMKCAFSTYKCTTYVKTFGSMRPYKVVEINYNVKEVVHHENFFHDTVHSNDTEPITLRFGVAIVTEIGLFID